MNTYAIDFETYYDDTIGFEANGNCGYVEHPDFNAYMVSVSGSDGFRWTGHPSKLDWRMFDGQRCLAHNASFDEAVYNRHFHTGIGPAEWHCTADLAAFSGYPRSLAGVMQQKYGKTRDKSIRDKMKGINPEVSANDPVNLAYAQEDADDCLRIWMDLSADWPLIERRISYLTRRMGWIGIQLDMKYVEECCKTLGDQYTEIVATIPWANSAKINSRPALFQFLRDCGIPVPASTNRNDEAFQNWLEEYSAAPDASEHMKVVRNIANLRSINKTLNQFKTLRGRAREDESFPYSKFYYGAHTGRFAGAGGFNMENLNREDKFGTNLRRAFVPRPGHTFIIADYSQIEPRVLAWLCGDNEFLDRCREMSPYVAHGVVTGRIKDPVAFEKARKIKDSPESKVYSGLKAELLLLGYGGGGVTFQRSAKVYGVDVDIETAKRIVSDFRASKPLLPRFWREQEQLFRQYLGQPKYDRLLPSGRALSYWSPRREQTVVKGQPQMDMFADTVKGGRKFAAGDAVKKIYGGFLTENCFTADTLVLTPYGTCPIAGIKRGDFVWDGMAFVKTDGAVCSGNQKVVSFGGVRVTPDHPVHTSTGWKRVKDTTYEEAVLAHARSFGDTFWAAGSSLLRGIYGTPSPVESPVRLRDDEDNARGQAPEGAHEILRLRTAGSPETTAHDSQHVPSPGVCSVVLDAAAVSDPGASGFFSIRGEGDHGLPGVGDLRAVLDGHGADLRHRPDIGEAGQQQGVQPGELQVGNPGRAGQEHAPEPNDSNSAGTDASLAGGEHLGNRTDDPALPAFGRCAGGADVRQAGSEEEVYDLLNCGPNHRFTVVGRDGRVFTAHNCTQAIARDVLIDALDRITTEIPEAPAVLTVHDELVFEVNADNAEALLPRIQKAMTRNPIWMPGVPLDVSIEIADYYKK